MQDVEDEPLFAERVAGIDIAKAGIEVAVRVPSDTTAGRRQRETRSFRTTRKGDTGGCPARKGADVGQVSLWRTDDRKRWS